MPVGITKRRNAIHDARLRPSAKARDTRGGLQHQQGWRSGRQSAQAIHAPGDRMIRLAVVVSHPIQYFAPWFQDLSKMNGLALKVFYLWDFGVEARTDRSFGHTVQWDIPLLEGYEHAFLPNRSPDPGTHHFNGLDNPGLVEALVDWRPDAILLFGYAYRSHLRVILSRRLRHIPLLFRGDSHDIYRPTGLGPVLKRWVRARLFRRFAGFLAVGKANTAYFRNCGVPAARIHFAPHCVDNACFQAAAPRAAEEAALWRTELGIPEGARVVLFAGKFETKKRPMDLLEAFLQAASEFPVPGEVSPVLLFVGAGAWETRLRQRAGGSLGQSVFFAPFQNQSQMPKVYTTGDVLVLPSESETWGLAVNEAMNLGRPAIVSTHVGCGPDLIIEGETGWVFPAGDIEALTALLKQILMLDTEALRRMGKAVRDRVGGYSLEAATAGLKRALASLPVAWRPS